ncbi:MAG: acyl-CoA dehydrogenase family protein [Acetobacteraceae bacterium]
MDTMVEATRLPTDVDSHPLVRQARAMHPTLRRFADQIEREQRFPPELVAQLHEAGFYRMIMPRPLGGLQVDPVTYTGVVETLAEGCGSVGWNVANNCIAKLVTLGLPDEGIQEIHSQGPDFVIAGTAVAGGGQAVPVPGGYRVTGHWTFGTGCMEASWMLGSFQILDDGKPRPGPGGAPGFWRGLFPRSDTEIIPGTWDVTGLRGTGSFDWTVTDVFLPEHRVMYHAGAPVDNQWSRWPGLTYSLPSVAWVGPHHSSVVTGIARAGIAALIELATVKVPRGRGSALLKQSEQVQEAIARADTVLSAARLWRATTMADLWNTMASGGETTLQQRTRCRLAAVNAGDAARQAMDMVYHFSGTTGFKRGTRMSECWRDLHTVGQTGMVAPEWYPIGGRVFLGMDPGPRLQ